MSASRKGVSRFVKEANESNVFELDPDDFQAGGFNGDADNALDALREYYGSAAGLMPGACGDLEALDERDADDLISEAMRLGLM